ncbi:MAG TPA: macro domain-containing protein [Gemmataceae bacterium]|nr:macro domain-containing protein [Gemmataceae bacterium]
MLVQVILVDINPRMVQAWQSTFEENPEVQIVQGSMLDQQVDAWVSPTNAKGSMDGGLDAIIKGYLGAQIEARVQKDIARFYHGVMPLGYATCVPTGHAVPKFLISTPTMVASSQDVSDTLNVALACSAAFQAVHMQNARDPGSIRSVALPGLGANTGKVPPEICADLMWTGYNLFREQEFTDFGAMRVALEQQLGTLDPTAAPPPKKSAPSPPSKSSGSQPKPPPPKKLDVDFDDAE